MTAQGCDFADLLKNRFDFADYLTGFVDRHSQMVVTLSREYLGIDAIAARGLLKIREKLTSPSFRLQLESECDQIPASVSVSDFETYPWGALQNGILGSGESASKSRSTLVCPEHNVYVLNTVFESDSAVGGSLTLSLTGQFADSFTETTVEQSDGAIIFTVYCEDELSNRFYNTQDDFVPCWRLSVPGQSLAVKQSGECYVIDVGKIDLTHGTEVQMIIEVENRPPKQSQVWGPLPEKCDIDLAWQESKKRWTQMLGNIEHKNGMSRTRDLRAACILDRCGYRGKHGNWDNRIASMCMLTSWACTAFFWDSVFGVLGLAEFDRRQAEDALAVLFAFQDETGCVPTHAYESVVGSTFYPQAPLVSWAVLRMFRKYHNADYVKFMLPKMQRLFDWFHDTQDHDGDGLVEIRFTGQLADNAPQYDRYIAHVQPHPELWNIFVPPIASPAWNSFHYMDARCLAKLYELTGDDNAAQVVMDKVQHIPDRLVEICWDEQTQYFQDYDHHIKQFNRAHVLTAALPLWAGMPLSEKISKTVIEEHLLKPGAFYGDYPFPYLAYDDPFYAPEGYWRGRVWPHTTTWILELLWKFGYQKEADTAADRLLKMMNQQDAILENYFSDPSKPGGGSPDYQWASASYLYIVNRRYHQDIFSE
ncbi:MAG: hypothetical protein JW936_08790 [Sedimentisphaerales bacterium]|nr:hypothetical protein [Sedimentisphaerales bacterium]